MDHYFIRYLSFRKVFNVFKIYLGYLFSLLTKRPIVWGYPHSLTTEPTNRCNLECLECPTGNKLSKRASGNMNFELYKKIIDQVKPFVIYQMLYFQGEPFLHPEILKLIKYADQNKVYTCTSTNGHLLTPENCEKIIQSGLRKIIISVDGISQETYSKYRIKGNFKKVEQGITNIAQAKRKHHQNYPKIHLQFIVFNHNQEQINAFKKWAKRIGADKIALKSAQIENFELNKHLIPSIDKYSRYKVRNNKIEIKSKLKNQCARLWNTLVVTFDGNVLPCCFDKNARYRLGDLSKQSIPGIWNSSAFNDFRKKVLANRKKITICNNCTSGLRIMQ